MAATMIPNTSTLEFQAVDSTGRRTPIACVGWTIEGGRCSPVLWPALSAGSVLMLRRGFHDWASVELDGTMIAELVGTKSRAA